MHIFGMTVSIYCVYLYYNMCLCDLAVSVCVCVADRNTTGSPVCQDLQDKVFRCYTDNHKKTLLCSADVRAFFECVERARAVRVVLL